MSPPVERAALCLSGMGFPLTQVVMRRFGMRGALAVEAVCGGLLLRDVAMLAGGAPSRLRRDPAALLWFEAGAALAAVLTCLRPVLDADARVRAVRQRPDRSEALRRAAVGTLFGVHTLRFRIYPQPDHGLRVAGGDHKPPRSRPDSTHRSWLPNLAGAVS